MADENNSNEDGQFVPDGSMEPLSPQEADNTDYGLMVGERVQKKDLQQEMRESYLAYAMSVIVDRALPDVRDGMKPVHRRVIYAMYDGGYRPDRGYSKCARVVGEVMGKYHPHGDSAIYDTLVRMAQSWSMRYTLVDGQGNFGSPGDDPAAAMRYTECRMAPLAMEMVRDIDKDTVDFLPNYDGKTQEPTVLPARFPNLLCNGSSGIAVGMAGELDFKASFKERLALLKGLDVGVLDAIGASLRLTEGAEVLFAELKRLGYKTAILSGGFTYFAKQLQAKLGIDYVFANELEVVDGKVTGVAVEPIVDAQRKADLLRELAQKEGLSLEQTIAVGDGANDLAMLAIAGLGVAFRAKPLVKKSAKHAISTLGLDGVLYLLGQRDRNSQG